MLAVVATATILIKLSVVAPFTYRLISSTEKAASLGDTSGRHDRRNMETAMNTRRIAHCKAVRAPEKSYTFQNTSEVDGHTNAWRNDMRRAPPAVCPILLVVFETGPIRPVDVIRMAHRIGRGIVATTRSTINDLEVGGQP